MIWKIIIIVLVVYGLLMFVVPQFLVPNLGFVWTRLPNKIPSSIQKDIAKLKKKSRSKKAYLKNTYDLLTKRYHGGHIQTLTKFPYWFISDINRLAAMKGYLPCNALTYILQVFLVKSGVFSPKDIKLRITTTRLFIHQYAQVRIGKEWIDVDLYAAKYGVPFGEHGFMFV